MGELSEIKQALKEAQASLKEREQGQALGENSSLESPSDLDIEVQELRAKLKSRDESLCEMKEEVESMQLLKEQLARVCEEKRILQETCDKSLYQERRMCRSLEEVKGEMESLSSATIELMQQLESSRDAQREQSLELDVLRNAGANMQGEGKEQIIQLRDALAGECGLFLDNGH